MSQGNLFPQLVPLRRPLLNCAVVFWLCLLASFTLPAATTLTWTNIFGGSWNNAANWSPNQVPGPSDTALLTLGVVVTNNTPSSVSNLVFSPSTFYGSAPVTVSGAMYWSGGDLCGEITIASGGTLTVSNSMTFGRNGGNNNGGGTLTNLGTVVWAVSSVSGFGNAVIQNAGLWQIVANNALNSSFGTNLFINSGDIEETISGAATLSWTFNCTGTVNTPNGSLSMGNWFGSSTISGNATFSVGTMGASLAVASNSVVGWSSGISTGAISVAPSGTMNWSGGDLDGSLIISPGATLTVSNSTTFGRNNGNNDGGGALTNLGTVVWAVSSASGFGNAAIQNAGLWQIVANNALNNSFGTNFFANSGDIEEIISGAATLGWTFNCTGTINTPNGSLTMANWFGTNTVAGNVTFSLGTMNAPLTVVSNSIMGWTAGSAFGSVSVSPGSTLNWSGGDLDGPLTISPGATLSLSNSITFGRNNGNNFGGGAITNLGTVIESGSTHGTFGNSAIYNAGLWELIANNSLVVFDGTNIFINTGTLEKTNSGAASISWPFTTTGTINSTIGTLTLSTWSGSNVLHGAAGISFSEFTGSLTVASDGFFNWLSGDLLGTFVVAPGGTLAISNSITFGRNGGNNTGGGALTNFGTTLLGGNVNESAFGGAVVDNAGLWELFDANNFLTFAGTNLFVNTGTMVKSSPFSSSISWLFNTTGFISNTPASAFILSSWTGNSVIQGNAYLNLGTMTASLAVAPGSFLNWTGGDTMGNFVVAPGATLLVSNSVTFGHNNGNNDGGGTLTNFGTVIWTGNFNQGGYGSVVIDNAGLWELFDANNLLNFAGTNLFLNPGTLVKFGSSQSSISWLFNTTGFITNTPSTALILSGITGNNLLQGIASLNLGTLTTSLTVASNALLNWTGGDAMGNFVVAPGGTLAVSNGISFGHNNGNSNGGGTLTNLGTVLWTGNFNQAGYGGVTIANSGVWQLFDNNNFLNSVGSNVFVNSGVLERFSDAGTSTISWPFFNTGTVQSGAGTLSVQNGFRQTGGQTLLVGGNLSVSPGLQLDGGVLAGTNIITGPVTNNSVVKPGGDAAGQLSISGTYSQTAQGQLDIQIGGTGVGSNYDQLAVSGAMNLNGTLNVTLIDPFVPAVGNQFVAATFGSRTGDFSTVNGLVLTTNLALQASYTVNALNLTATATNSPGAPPAIIAQPQSQSIINGQTANFSVTATGTRPLFYQWIFNSAVISNQNAPTLTLVGAQTNAAGNYQVIVTNAAGSVTSAVATLTVQPVADLVITDVTNPTNAFATQPATFTWRSLNQGAQTATAPWIETIGLSTSPDGSSPFTIASTNVTSSLIAGQSVVRAQSVILPGGLDGIYYVVFTTDAANQVVELDYETNNVTVSSVPITIHSPDLRPVSISATGSAQLGQAIPVSWVDTNASASPAFSTWNDQVYLSPISNSLSSASFLATYAVTNVPLTNGASLTNGTTVTLPSPANLSAGSYFLVVDVDAGNAVAETNENNNLLSVPITLAQPPLPDLMVTGVAAPTNATPGTTVAISWGITNAGAVAVSNSWSETVFLATNSSGAGAAEVITFSFTNALPPGGSLIRSAMMPVPIDSSIGSNWFEVEVDTFNDIVEANESNNVTVATNATVIPAQLTLQFSEDQAVEGSAPFTGIVTRNGNQGSSLTVTLSNNTPSELSVPAQVIIQAGQASAAFAATPLDDGIVDGPQLVTVTANAAGFNPATDQVMILDVDQASLGLSFVTNSVLEGQTLSAVITRSGGTNSALSVNFNSSNPSRLVAPTTVTIPEGAFSNMFAVMAIDDLVVEQPTIVTVTAFATNCNSASTALTILDADLPQLTLGFASTNINETGGPQATTATLTRSPISDGPIYVELDSSDSHLVVPSLVTIPASVGSVSFPVGAINNNLANGSTTVEVDQWVRTTPAGPRVAEATPVFVTLVDNNSPALQLNLANSVVGKGANPATTGTVSRNTSTNTSLLVALTSSDTNQAIVPATVTIPAGAISSTFVVASLNDGVLGGSISLAISASASGFASATTPLTVSDSNLPDLVVQSVSAPTNADTQTFVSLGYTIRNQGLAPMSSNSIIQNIYLSPDTTPGDGVLVGQFPFNGALPAGLQFGQSFSVQMPNVPGDYWVIVQTDASNSVAEVLENNNTGFSAAPIHVTAAYNAVVSTTLQTAPANTPVPMTGFAFKPGNIPAPFVLVNIHIYVQGTHRIISAITDGNGNFSATWQPLPGEAGFYQIGAAHPGFTNAPAQATFTLYGMNANPAQPSVTLLGEGISTGAVEIINAGDTALSSIVAAVVDPPADLNFSLSLATNSLGGNGSNALTFTINSTDGQPKSGTVTVHLTSAEGAVLDLPFAINVMSLNPQLVASPAPLVRGIQPGVQSFASFVVTNIGGATSGPVTISLPQLQWLSLTSTNPLPPLAPGDSVTVSLQMMPDASLSLGDITGNILLSDGNVVASEPFDFRVLSTGNGSLLVNSQDEFTYYAVGSPPLTNATVTLLDSVSNNVVTNGVTDGNGQWFAPQLQEGFYTLELTASNHSSFKSSIFVGAGVTNTVNAFLQLQTVTYTWTVVPTDVQDHYTIQVQTEFEANVPAPVVTVDPSVIDLSGLTTTTQVNLTVANHGLIAAQNFELQFDDYPSLSFQPLVSSLGTLPAQSTFTIPVIITRTNSQSQFKANDLSDISECFATARGMDEYVCGPNLNFQVTTISFPNAGTCLAALIPGFSWLPGGGGGGGVSQIYCQDCGRPPPPPRPPSTWPNFPPGTNSPILEFLAAVAEKACPALVIPNACDPECAPKLAKALFECVMPADPDALPGCLNDVAAGCGPATFRQKNYNDAVNCVAGIASCWIDVSKEVTHTECLFNILEACAPDEENSSLKANGVFKSNDLTFSGPYADLLGTLQTRVDRIVALNNFYYTMWGDPAWANTSDQTNARVILSQFEADTGLSSDQGQFISPTELSGLLSLPLPAGIASSNVTHLATWWNRTLTNWQSGIFNLSDVPAGQSTDFLALDQYGSAIGQATNAVNASIADGFTSLEGGIQDAVNGIVDRLNIPSGGGTCARVQLQLDQQAVLSRDAFKATLSINNTEGEPLQNLNVTIGVFDTNGNDASSLFQIQPAVLGGIDGTNGDGTVPTGGTGTLTWTLVPASDAAPTNITSYFVSGGLNYNISDNSVSIPLAPTAITVYPSPRLSVKYFCQRDVYADDPTTPIVEPSIPFSLAVMVQNTGQGTAKDFTITSAQPQIVDNEKGLLINFQIIATEVAGQNLQPTLTADIGDIAPGTNGIAQWLMISSLQGLFINYSATFQNVDDLGNSRLSLIDDVSIHEMIRVVDAGGTFEDGRPDFLVNDVPDPNSFPDTLYLSDGSTNHVQAVMNDAVLGTLSPANLQIQVTAPMPGGWAYLNVPDPGNGNYILTGIVRSDSTRVPVNTNAWVTDRTFIGLSKAPIRENILHLLDYNSTGSYTLTYVPNPANDITPPTSSIAPLPAQSSVGIPLHWSGQDDLSGIASFDIYVSINGGAFLPWLTGVTGNSAIYQGVLGNTYAFYSLALDNAGNRQSPPASPNAVTTVTMTNQAPQIAAISNQTVVAGNTLLLIVPASDPDSNTLSFALGAGSPPGVTLNSQSGALSWQTSRTAGSSTNTITVKVTDSGIPPLSATQSFQVFVIATNTPPILSPIADQIVSAGQLLSITNTASDSDFPAQTLTFSLGPGAPTGVALNSSNGVFSWTPADFQGGTTNSIQIIVTDNGTPPLGATQSFSITVVANGPGMVMNIGTTDLLVGATSSVPISLTTDADLTNLTLLLNLNSVQLTNFTLSGFASQVASAQIQPVANNQYQLQFQSQSNTRLQGAFNMANLDFGTTASSNSTIVALNGQSLSGLRGTSLNPVTGIVNGGRVFVIGNQPLLDAHESSNQNLALTVYGLPGKRYSLESMPDLSGTNGHTVVSTFKVSALRTDLPFLPIQHQRQFFRARLLPDSDLTVSVQSNQLVIDWPLACTNCLLEQSGQLGANASWIPVAATAAIVNTNWQVTIPAPTGSQYYRLQLPP